MVREFLARRIANLARSDTKSAAPVADPHLELLVDTLARIADPAIRLDMLRGMHAAPEGRSHVRMPRGWQSLYRQLESGDPPLREQARHMALIFGDPRATESLRRLAAQRNSPVAERRRAIEALVQVRDPKFTSVLIGLMADAAVRGTVLRGLAAYDDAAIPATILRDYRLLTADEKQTAIGTLASRPRYALALLQSVEQNKIPASDISIYTVRQLRELQVPAAHQEAGRRLGQRADHSGRKRWP